MVNYKTLFFISTIFILTGCSITPDHDALLYIENYSAEIIPAVEAALVDLVLWLESPGPDDDELLDKLQEHAATITEINHRYWTENMPENTVIEKWKITREYDGKTCS